MIEQVRDPVQLKQFSCEDIFSVRILSLAFAYGCKYNFARFYRQLDDDGNLTAIASVLDGAVTLSVSDNADIDELAVFFLLSGYSSLLCDARVKINARCDEGVIMKIHKTFDVVSDFAVVDEYPKLMDLFNFIDYESQDFESWYVDLSYRIRHGAAKAATLNVNGKIVSSALFTSIYNNKAVLSSVCTSTDSRNKGYASTLIKSMISDFGGTVYLMREADKNESFYLKLGFINIGRWRIYK